MNKQTPQISHLRADVERRVGRRMRTPKDFDHLANAIWEEIHETISSSTLKRLWGYVDGSDEIRIITMDILVHYLGFRNWEQYEEVLKEDVESDGILGMGVRSSQLKEGDEVTVAWMPDRQCRFRYMGNYRYVIVAVENSKLQVGDECDIAWFIKGHPLHLDNLRQERSTLQHYIAGSKNGLTQVVLHKA